LFSQLEVTSCQLADPDTYVAVLIHSGFLKWNHQAKVHHTTGMPNVKTVNNSC